MFVWICHVEMPGCQSVCQPFHQTSTDSSREGQSLKNGGKCQFQMQLLIIYCLVMKMCISIFLVLYLDSLIYDETAVLASSFSLYHFNIADDIWYLLLIESNKIIQKRFMDFSFIWNCFYCHSICQWPTVNPKVNSMQEVWVNSFVPRTCLSACGSQGSALTVKGREVGHKLDKSPAGPTQGQTRAKPGFETRTSLLRGDSANHRATLILSEDCFKNLVLLHYFNSMST